MTDDDKSLGDQHTFDGETPGKPDTADASLGDEKTYAGGANAGPSSLGDQMTFAGVAEGLDDDLVDDDMQITDLHERYTIEGELGKGGMGEVLLATDTRLERKVAIKRILGKAARSKKAWQRFDIGAKTIAKLNHPNIVQVYDHGLAKDGPFMILEYVQGGSLLDRCKQGPIPLEEAIEITCQLCDGIGKAHAAGIIHRDIKPANVLMTEDGIPKLSDFDLAKEQAGDSGMTQEGAVLGTLVFMPPEQQQDAALVDQRSDLWSLAATLYQMVTGKSPKIIKFKDVPESLHDVLSKALEDEKDDRYQDAREFRDALRASLAATEQPVVEALTDLGTGECPECHTKNESTRKFCSECAAPLRVDCLGCEQSIPVWDKVCGECGGRQVELIEKRKTEIEQDKVDADSLADDYQFEKAIALAEPIAANDDNRVNQQREWALTFLQETNEAWEREKQSAQTHYAESQKHRAAFDYDAAIEAIDVIPGPMRSPEMVSYLSSLESDKQELRDLIPTIKERVKSRDVDGLLALVDRAVELRGKPGNLAKLQQQLRDRDEKQRRKREQERLEQERLEQETLKQERLEQEQEQEQEQQQEEYELEQKRQHQLKKKEPSRITVQFDGVWMLVDCKFQVSINGNVVGSGKVVKGGSVFTEVKPGMHTLKITGPLGRKYTKKLTTVSDKSCIVALKYSRTKGWFDNCTVHYA